MPATVPLNINIIVTTMIWTIMLYAWAAYSYRFYVKRSIVDLCGSISGLCHALGTGVSVVFFCISDVSCYYRTAIAIPSIFLGYVFFFLMLFFRAVTIQGISENWFDLDTWSWSTFRRINWGLKLGFLCTFAYLGTGIWYYTGAVAFRNGAGVCTNTQYLPAITTWAVLLGVTDMILTGSIIKALWDHTRFTRRSGLQTASTLAVQRLVEVSTVGLIFSVVSTAICYAVLIPGYAQAYGILTGNLAAGLTQGAAIGVLFLGQALSRSQLAPTTNNTSGNTDRKNNGAHGVYSIQSTVSSDLSDNFHNSSTFNSKEPLNSVVVLNNNNIRASRHQFPI